MTREQEPVDGVHRATQDLLAQAIVAPTSHEVSDPIEEFANGKVKVFGELSETAGRRSVSPVSAQRTEIEVDGGIVAVHRGLNNAGGIFAAARRLNQIDVRNGTETHRLTVQVDPTTSASNPIYVFFDGETRVGLGSGQRIDLALASALVGQRIPEGSSSQLTPAVTNWIKGKLA